MKSIWNIYKRDIRNIIRNPVALIIIIGLCILPSLYAWFNIYASWDPYGNTNGVKVAVVNNDKGGVLLDKRELNIGKDIVEKLKDNTQIGWVFVDSNAAQYGLSHNMYYATIEIPEDFSEKISTITSDNPIKPELIYKVNEKSNAIAPKITSAGTKELIKQITASFADEVNSVVFSELNVVGETLGENKSRIIEFRDLIYKLNDNIDVIDEKIDEVGSGLITLSDFLTVVNEKMPMIKDTIGEVQSVSQSVRSLAATAQSEIKNTEELIKLKLVNVKQINSDFNQLLSGYIENRGESSNLSEVADQLLSKAESNEAKVDSMIQFFTMMNKDGSFTTTINDLNRIKTELNTLKTYLSQLSQTADKGYEFNTELLNTIKSQSDNLGSLIDDKVNGYEAQIKPQIENTLSGTLTITSNVDQLMDTAEKQLPAVNNLLELSSNKSELGLEYINKLRENMPEISEGISTLTSKLKEVASDDDLNQITNLLINPASELSEYISNPINLVEESVYTIPNYGSAMAPFYSVLAIWVGVLILSSILTTEVRPFDDGFEPTIVEQYFGKLLLFLTLAIIQSFTIAVGDKYILGVYMDNTALFIGFSVFTSIIFTLVVYTLVSVFGNVGKAIGVILLVLQVAGSGGTFPIEVTPKFFQTLQPFLPFTYAIGSLREAVGGALWSNVTRDFITLLVFGAVALFLGLILKKPLNHILEKANEKFKESGISE